MKIEFKNCTELELWHYVATYLKKKDIDTILVGGAVVSIYSEGAYKSGDLDFVHANMFVTGLEEAMREIGFIKQGRHFVHPECKHLFVEFPGGPPVGIGEDYTIIPDEVEVDGTIIKIFSPTDCVKDRLATYIYFKAPEGLDQAILVTKKHSINFEKVKDWCESEGHGEVYEKFINELKKV